MNYQGIVDWLQEDGFVLLGFSGKGEVSLMEKVTGEEVNDIPAFLVASVLPIAKKKVSHLLLTEGAVMVSFVEERVGDVYKTTILNGGASVAYGTSTSFEKASVMAIEQFILNKKGEVNDQG